MNLTAICDALRAERKRIDNAIAILEPLGSAGNPKSRRRKRRMTAAGRKRLSQLMKARWAQRKRAARSR